MIKPFSLRNLALVRRLSEHSITLHAESALTGNCHPLRGALTSMWVNGSYPTYIWKAKDGDAVGFAQLRVEEDNPHAQIVCLGLDGALNDGHGVDAEEAWMSLLEHMVAECGRRGLHSLTAEANESGFELPLLRRTGFAIYTRQDIWVATGVGDGEEVKPRLSPRKSADDWDIQLLYANTVPRLLQQVEPTPPLHYGEGWVLRQKEDLAAFVHLYDGPAGAWLRLYVHRDAQHRSDEIVAAALQLKEPTPEHPVYCCVRRYQGWLQSSLERAGYQHWGRQVVLVKHTVQHSQGELRELPAALETQGIPGSTTAMHPIHNSRVGGGFVRNPRRRANVIA